MWAETSNNLPYRQKISDNLALFLIKGLMPTFKIKTAITKLELGKFYNRQVTISKHCPSPTLFLPIFKDMLIPPMVIFFANFIGLGK